MFPYIILFQLAQERRRQQEQEYYQQGLWEAPRFTLWQHISEHLHAFFSRLSASKRHCDSSIPLEMADTEKERLSQNGFTDMADTEKERLSQNGFTDKEIIALFRLRQRYSMWGRSIS